MEAKRLAIFFDLQKLKPGGFKSCSESARVDWDKRIPNMNDPHEPALQAVAAHENSSRFQYPPYLAQNPVLQFWGRDVVQHGETGTRRELAVQERHSRGIPGDNLDVAAA